MDYNLAHAKYASLKAAHLSLKGAFSTIAQFPRHFL